MEEASNIQGGYELRMQGRDRLLHRGNSASYHKVSIEVNDNSIRNNSSTSRFPSSVCNQLSLQFAAQSLQHKLLPQFSS